MSVISELRMRPSAAHRWGWDASTKTRLVLAVVVISALLIGANLATPLYALIQTELGLSAFDTTVAFSAYVLTLVGGLMMVGHWSDHIGRRAALVLAVLTGVAGLAVFGLATSLPLLVLGRCLQGAAVAVATGASAAALRDLLPHRPEWASRFTLLASAGGVAAGPVIGGLLSLLPDPTTLPFALYGGVLAMVLIPLLVLKARPAIKPAVQPRPLTALRPRRPAVSRAAARAFWTASTIGFLSFSVFGFTLSLAPTYFTDITGEVGRPVIGLLAALVLASSAFSQLLSLRGRFLVPVGLTLMGFGVAGIPIAHLTGSLPLLVVCCLAAGFGQGAAFRVVFNKVAMQVEPSQHAQIISTLYVITYLGSAVPVLGLGALATAWGLDAAVAAFSAAITVACLVMAALVARRAVSRSLGRRPPAL